MWLSQQKRTNRKVAARSGPVTMAGNALAVGLEGEVRDPVVYVPAGYRWTPRAGQQVLVLKGEGERPAIVGTLREELPEQVTIAAGTLALEGAVTVNGVPLAEYIAAVAGGAQ